MSMRHCLVVIALVLFLHEVPVPAGAPGDKSPKKLRLTLRDRIKDKAGNYAVRHRVQDWAPQKTAIIICDMWNDHYCVHAAERVAEMAPHMNQVISLARQQGVLIIHCPSGCMDEYKDTPQRKLAQQAPPVATKIPLKPWCNLDKDHEPPLPIDDTNPCEDEKPRPAVKFFSKQHDALKIAPGDAITDSAEAFYLMKQKGITNVILMGVHTNMCVLGRPFGIRQLVGQGMNVVLMRDLTDTMYNPKMKPFVSHFRGTELVLEHIEKYWCPTMTSTDFTGQAPFRFKGDDRPHVVFVTGGSDMEGAATMPRLADLLADQYGCCATLLPGRGKIKDYEIPGLAALRFADVMVLCVRFRALPPAQLGFIKEYLGKGKPLVALYTSVDAFGFKPVPTGYANWPEFGKEVLGGFWAGQDGPKPGFDVKVVGEASHPILKGLNLTTWHSAGTLMHMHVPDKSATVLLRASAPPPGTPVAWTHSYKGGKVFFTTLGTDDDFEQAQVRQLVINAVFWAMNRPVLEKK
jgi:nicotinamidase-related amidase